jgi:ubiquinone/menaquinone biosynthesis C-methylase UbiE
VKAFWEEHPLLGYELPHEPGSDEFFAAYDRLRETVEFRYCYHLLRLAPELKGKKVLDVGCGNGWLLSQYARCGLETYGLDLTLRAVQLSTRRFGRSGLKGRFLNASAEELPFAGNTFDVVTSLGVIHHTPRTELCASEIIRVCKPGGRVLIAVYYENLLVKRWFFFITRLALKALGRADRAKLTRQEFINHYDGPGNPLGKVYTARQACALAAGLEDIRHEIHYFPKRFVPTLAGLPLGETVERLLDRTLGFLIYVEGTKPRS